MQTGGKFWYDHLMRFLKIFALIVPFVVLGRVVFFKEPPPKIYGCFPFFNELEPLQVRLSEMNDHVDKFVILESTETYSGKPKPLHFAENRRLFDFLSDLYHSRKIDSCLTASA